MSTIVADSIEPRTSGGAVTFPNRPAFHVRGYGSINTSSVINGITMTGNDIMYNYQSIDINRDNAFNNSTGIYTVPVAGLYQIHGGFGYKASSNYMAITIYATPNDDAGFGFVRSWANNDNNHTGRHISALVDASVGQEFAFAVSKDYSTPNTNIRYLWFSAFMVG